MKNYSFGNYLCSLREKKGLSQSQLGERLGVSNKAVSKWENGGAYPSSELMYPLAKELGVSIEELYRALSDSKAEKTSKRKLLDFFVGKANIITIGLIILYVVLLILHLIFCNLSDKYMVVFLSVFIGALVHASVRIMLFMLKKNPIAPSGYIDICSLAFLLCGVFSMLTDIANFISYFPNGFLAGNGVWIGFVSGVLYGNKKRS